jgi:23S rRNA pseudouridine1911/1915/1917 synthase
LDLWLSRGNPECSRARWQQLIRAGQVTVDGEPVKPNYSLRPGQGVAWTLPPPVATDLVPEDRPIRVLLEDEQVLVLDKPPGWVVHPSAGHDTGTLVHALLHHCGDGLAGIGGERRPGIVHRLDRDTSGVMVVAKTETALRELVRQFKAREVRKEYLALVAGRIQPPAGRLETLIARSPSDRQKMSARVSRGRPAITRYETAELLEGASLVRIRLETGRTHQIRVHMAHLGCPVLGDTTYGRTGGAVPAAPRQMLHSHHLTFAHPVTGRPVQCTAPLPEDFLQVLNGLRIGPSGATPA